MSSLAAACGTHEPVVIEPVATPPAEQSAVEVPADRLTSFRVRSDFDGGLNVDSGWAGGLNETATIDVEHPFRIRFEVESPAGISDVRRFRLQYRRNEGAWMNVQTADFPYPEEATPRISVVSASAYENGAATTDLLQSSSAVFSPGAGLSLSDVTHDYTSSGATHSEWEWPLVIRRFADGAVTNEDGDVFEFRIADAGGCPIASDVNPHVIVSVPPRLLAGTFVETPARLGPYEASNGDLYFMMEPSETFNVLMVVKSSDGGETWHEVDPANRPVTDDLEGFATDFTGDSIYMLHQTSDDVWLHSFRTSDHPTDPDTWDIRDEHVMAPEEPPTQVATLTIRSDGSMVGVYGGPQKIHYKIRAADGIWGTEEIVDADLPPTVLSGPQTVLGAGDVVHLAYTGFDEAEGSVWYRRIEPDGSLSPREQLASGLGTAEGDVGSVLPLLYIEEENTAVVIYRASDGRLWERRVVGHGAPTEAVQVSDRSVVQNSVDSDQTGADAIAHGSAVHVLFIDEDSRHIYHTLSDAPGRWAPATLVQGEVNAQWVRGQPLTRGGDEPIVYGFVYDAGSDGGSGMNRYGEIPLGSR